MLINRSAYFVKIILLIALIAVTVMPQNLRVYVGKRSEAVPKACESIVPASVDDVPALIREVNCRGAGDMLVEYTYTTTVTSRSKDKKGLIKEESTTYEVYIPALKEGMRAMGILLETAHNGVPVAEKTLEKERLKAGERLEKEDKKITEKTPPEPKTETAAINGMTPIGMYTSMGSSRSVLGVRRGGATLRVQTFLEACDLKFLRRGQSDGRDVLIFSFTPRPNIPFDTNEKYVARLAGEIWIDVTDHIVSRLTGWPANMGQSSDKPPAIHTEMVRLPTGVWLPGVFRINGLDYPNLFDNISGDTNISYSEYKRFVTDVKRTK
jgi:hypothetical protein